MTIEWARPAWLLALALLPALAWWLARNPAAVRFPAAGRLRSSAGRVPRAVAVAPLALRIAALALIVLALARPRTVRPITEDTTGVPVVVAIDLSSSMLAEDLPANRLDVARRTVARFVEGRPGDPIGLVAFAGQAITMVPVTTDHALLLRALARLRVGLLDDGTAIGDGLAIAANRLRSVPGSDRVIVLMSDGENNQGRVAPLDAARAAAAFGLRVFTIGVGTDALARVPIEHTPEGTRYGTVGAGLDEELLREIAGLTGGQYFRATDSDALDSIYARIGRLIAPPSSTRAVARHEWFGALLLAASVLLVTEWLLRGSRWGAVPT